MTGREGHRIEHSLPFWALGDLFGPDRPACLLDSALIDGKLGRWSFFAGQPAALLTGRRRTTDHDMDLNLETRRTPGDDARGLSHSRTWTGDPFTALRELKNTYAPVDGFKTSAPFTGGLVGYFGYETAYAVEDLPDTGRDDLQLPDLAFMVVDEVLAHEHATGHTRLFANGNDEDRVTAWQDRIAAFEAGMPGMLSPATSRATTSDSGLPPEVAGDFDADSYAAMVARCRQHILAGDVFEVCPTQRLEMDLRTDPWRLYAALRSINPAPFGAWLRLPGFAVACASPERFLRLDEDRVAESRPIKGTRPRGSNPEADAALRRELEDSAKDRAENVMIVDLVRNDLGRVCETGSVRVDELQVIEAYATVFQMVSTVRGRLRPDLDACDLVRACFPGGSMTGAPKVAAMKIIDRLEPVKRGVYSGALGYLDWSGRLDLNIVIRTVVCREGRASFGVGGAVVSDSDPAAEYRETLDKARALIDAVNLANASGHDP